MSKDTIILAVSLAIIGAGFFGMRWLVLHFVRWVEAKRNIPTFELPVMPVENQLDAAAVKPNDLPSKPFPFPVITVPGTDALATFDKLKAEGQDTPLIVGDPALIDGLNFWLNQPSAPSPTQILARANVLKQPFSIEDYFAAEYGDSEDDEENEALQETGRWPAKVEAMTETILHCDLQTRTPLPLVSLIRVSCFDSPEIFAYLNWGNWNANPPPHVHVALLQKWQKEWGAEVIGITADSLNIRVKRRPETRKEAIALAREQVFYCSDVIEQAPGQLKYLAATLMKSDVWHFWWD